MRRLAIALICCAWLMPLAASAAPAGRDAPPDPASVTPTNEWADFYSYHLTFAGLPAPVGTAVTAFDSQGTQCAERTTGTAGYLAPVMPCYGDDPKTPADEGAVDGNLITFKVNGVAATATARALNWSPVSPATPIKWHSKDAWEIDLVMAAQPLVTVTRGAGQTNLAWPAAAVGPALYEVWRGNRPYFNPLAGEGELLGTIPASATPLGWSDAAGAGDPALNVTYRVLSKTGGGALLGASQEVGEFDFALVR